VESPDGRLARRVGCRLESPKLVAMINCPKCNEENPAKFRLCGYCGTPLVAAPPTLPVHEVRHTVRRTVTLLFCDLKGSTALAESLDPEAMHEVKERYFATMAAEITKHGGKIEKYIGDAIMAVFGAPLDMPDHATRAIKTALEMQERLAEWNADRKEGPAFRIRIGINSGNAVAGEIGSINKKEYTVLGDTVNIASRLESSVARPMTVVIGENTFHAVKDQFECRSLGNATLKGKEKEVAVFEVVGPLRATEPASQDAASGGA